MKTDSSLDSYPARFLPYRRYPSSNNSLAHTTLLPRFPPNPGSGSAAITQPRDSDWEMQEVESVVKCCHCQHQIDIVFSDEIDKMVTKAIDSALRKRVDHVARTTKKVLSVTVIVGIIVLVRVLV
ncbi:hypothetical protein PAXINDRAFT_17107 [Paxillus involutus ATCC 200175]|uniref:Uncharacterized protein n=1 Tax=Paxillus involutus ATCC 200175 TaxID=664439 RepID=A0A0C9TG49_PAXIN|nr:hypothetical protein PAXINDRAFT_17107 [Paxillus involutus ATCC 200175]